MNHQTGHILKNFVGHVRDESRLVSENPSFRCPPQQVHVSTEGFSHLMEPELEGSIGESLASLEGSLSRRVLPF